MWGGGGGWTGGGSGWAWGAWGGAPSAPGPPPAPQQEQLDQAAGAEGPPRPLVPTPAAAAPQPPPAAARAQAPPLQHGPAHLAAPPAKPQQQHVRSGLAALAAQRTAAQPRPAADPFAFDDGAGSQAASAGAAQPPGGGWRSTSTAFLMGSTGAAAVAAPQQQQQPPQQQQRWAPPAAAKPAAPAAAAPAPSPATPSATPCPAQRTHTHLALPPKSPFPISCALSGPPPTAAWRARPLPARRPTGRWPLLAPPNAPPAQPPASRALARSHPATPPHAAMHGPGRGEARRGQQSGGCRQQPCKGGGTAALAAASRGPPAPCKRAPPTRGVCANACAGLGQAAPRIWREGAGAAGPKSGGPGAPAVPAARPLPPPPASRPHNRHGGAHRVPGGVCGGQRLWRQRGLLWAGGGAPVHAPVAGGAPPCVQRRAGKPQGGNPAAPDPPNSHQRSSLAPGARRPLQPVARGRERPAHHHRQCHPHGAGRPSCFHALAGACGPPPPRRRAGGAPGAPTSEAGQAFQPSCPLAAAALARPPLARAHLAAARLLPSPQAPRKDQPNAWPFAYSSVGACGLMQ